MLPVTINKASELTGISVKELRKIVNEHLGGFKPGGKTILIEIEKLESHLKQNPFRSKDELNQIAENA